MTEEWRNTETLHTKDITVPNGSAQPVAGVDLGGMTLVGVILPATFGPTTLTLLTSVSLGGTYVGVQDGAGADYSVTVAAGKYVPLDPTKTCGLRFVKPVFGSNVTADRVVGLALRKV